MNAYPRKTVAALTLLFGASTGLWAQAPAGTSTPSGSTPTGDTVLLDPVVSTGTRFGTAASQADVPVFVVGRMQIQTSSVTEVADYLKSLPSFTGAGNTNESQTNGGTGGRFVDLRGLGSQYTLVLLNGRRLSYAGTDNIVDVNQVPITAVDHVEVLMSGASAIYGSDAIGGVVNIITRRNQNGAEVDAFYGDIGHRTDLGRRQFSFSVGGSEGKIDFLFGGQYYKQNGIYSNDFTWASVPGPTANTYPLRLSMPNSLFTPGETGDGNYLVKWKPGEGGRRDATSPGDFRAYDGALPDVADPDAGGDQFPFYLYTPLLRPEERYNAFAFTTYNLTPNIRIFGDVMYRWAHSYNQLAPAAIPVPALGAIVIPADNYYNQQIFGANAPEITAGGWRLASLGPRLDTQTATSVWFNTGIEGRINADWRWRFEGLFTQEDRQDLSGNTTSVALINQELAKTTPDAFNPFSSKLEANANIWGAIRRNAYLNNRSRLTNLQLTVDGNAFQMTHGPVKAAFSVEWNRLMAFAHPDALMQDTPLGFNGTPFPTDGSRIQWGISAEAELPILPTLTGRFAGRHDDYSDFGGATVGQASMRFQPNRELLFRANYGEGFIAPSILQLYEGPQVTNPQFIDPSLKNADGTWGGNSQVSLTRIGNPNLKPEKAEVWGTGFAYSPQGIQGLTLSIDYWNVNQTDVVTTADDYAKVVAQRFWEALGSSDAARDAAARNPATLATAVAKIEEETGVTVLWEPDGGPTGLGGLSENNIAMTNVSRVNLAGQKTDGVDLSASYAYDAGERGNFLFDVKAIYTNKFDYQALPDDPFQRLGGMYSSGFEGIWPKWRYNASVLWRWRSLGASATYRYTDRVGLDFGTDSTYNRDYLPSFTTWDFQVSYQLTRLKTRLAIGVENAFDRSPPQTEAALNNFVPAGAYDVKGAFYYVRLNQRF